MSNHFNGDRILSITRCNWKLRRWAKSRGWLGLGLAWVVIMTGCEPASDPLIDLVDARAGTVKVDDIQRALSLVTSSQGYAQKEFEEKTAGDLNRWLTRLQTQGNENGNDLAETWVMNDAVTQLIGNFSERGLPAIEGLAERSYLNTDAYFLRQANWCQAIVERVLTAVNPKAYEFQKLAAGSLPATGDANQDFLNQVAALHPALTSAQHQQLADVLKLFDWVIRNTQLDPEVVIPESELSEASLVENATGIPWLDGVRGLGYMRTPYELLTFARGDYVERAKLFIKLLEQRDLRGAVLAVAERPWAVAVAVGDQWFLFDTRLGLPIPNGRPGTVATLQQVRENPELLKSLDLTLEESVDGDNRYGVTADQLSELTAWIYISPESVSRRMAFLEQRMVGDNRLRLTQDPGKLLQDWSGVTGVTPRLWDIDFRHHAFRHAVREALLRARTDDVLQQRLTWYYENESYVDGFVAYRTARNMFIHGEFVSERNSNKTNAVEDFYLMMYTDKTIDNIATNTGMQIHLGILKGAGQSSAEYLEYLRGVQSQMRLVRRDAGLFLAQALFDKGNVGTSGNWLDRISLSTDAQRWTDGIRYLLGRTLESRLEFDKAIEEYTRTTTAQKHGNLLRARYLKSMLSPTSATTAETPTSDPANTEAGSADDAEQSGAKADGDGGQ